MGQTPFSGTINVDIRDSEPDWSPFEPPKAPDGAPNVLYIVLDDVGFSAMSCYGGPIETPNIDRIVANGVRYTQFHTTALCSPTRSCLLTGRNHTRNSMACITEAAIGFPNASGTIPPENGMLSEILGERGWNTYMVGKWHLCPTDEMNLASTRRNWPSGRGFERWYGFLGAETNQWYPRPRLRQPSGRPAEHPRRGLPPHRRHHRQGARVHPRREGGRAREAVLPLLRARRLPRAPPCAEGVDRQVQGAVRHGLRGDPRGDARERRRSSASCPPTRSCRRSTRSATRRAPGRTGRRSRCSTSRGPGTSLSDDEKKLFARMAEVYAGFLGHADYHIGRLLDYLEANDLLENTMIVVVSDNGASGEGGPDGSVNEMKFANGVPDDLAQNLAMIDELGGTKTYNHYPNGWAMAFNTPFKMWKRYEFNGGTSDPCIISWPAGTKARGEIRHQYHHAIDIVPTILDVLGVEPPETIKGHTQSQFDGVSMRESFDDASTRVEAEDAVLRDARLPLDLARGLEGGDDSSDRRRLGQLQRRRMGALPRRRRPFGGQQPRRRAAREAAGAREHLVLRGRRERCVPARRPHAGRDPDGRRVRSWPLRATGTSTSRTRRRSASGRRSTRRTARS